MILILLLLRLRLPRPILHVLLVVVARVVFITFLLQLGKQLSNLIGRCAILRINFRMEDVPRSSGALGLIEHALFPHLRLSPSASNVLLAVLGNAMETHSPQPKSFLSTRTMAYVGFEFQVWVERRCSCTVMTVQES